MAAETTGALADTPLLEDTSTDCNDGTCLSSAAAAAAASAAPLVACSFLAAWNPAIRSASSSSSRRRFSFSLTFEARAESLTSRSA